MLTNCLDKFAPLLTKNGSLIGRKTNPIQVQLTLISQTLGWPKFNFYFYNNTIAIMSFNRPRTNGVWPHNKGMQEFIWFGYELVINPILANITWLLAGIGVKSLISWKHVDTSLTSLESRTKRYTEVSTCQADARTSSYSNSVV